MKKISKLIIVATLLISILFSFGCNNKNLPVNDSLLNGSFEQIEDGKPSGWYTFLGTSDSSVTASNTGINGSKVIKIDSNGGWSYACQSIKVEKNTWYKVSADIRIVETIVKDSSSVETIGAYVGFLENTSIVVNNKQAISSWSNPDKTKYVIYINSESLNKLTITLNVGADGRGSSGVAEFDNVSIVKVDDSAIAGIDGILLKYITKGMNNFDTFNIKYSGIVVALAGIVALAVIVLLYLQLRKHNEDLDANDNSKSFFYKKRYVIIVFAVAMMIRLLVGLFSSGTNLISIAKNWNVVLDSNFVSYYGQYGANGGLPIAVYINYLCGKLTALLGIRGVILYKLPSIICDAVATIFIYKLAKKFTNESKSLIFAGLYALLPATILLSSSWGIASGIVTMLLVMTLYFIIDKKFVPMSIAFVFALLTDKTAIYALPVILVYLVYVLIKQPEYRKTIILVLIASVLGMALAFLPLVFTMLKTEPLAMFYQYFVIIFGATSKYSVTMPNIYTLFNLSAITVSSTSFVFNIILLLLMGVFTVFVYFKNRNRKDILMLVAYAYCALSIFAIGADVSNMLVMCALALTYLVVSQDRRIYYVLAAYGLLASLDVTYLVAKTGILGDSVNCIAIITEYFGAFHYVIAVLSILVTFYFTYLVYDITIEKQNKLIRSL